jgi:hypothetical protein
MLEKSSNFLPDPESKVRMRQKFVLAVFTIAAALAISLSLPKPSVNATMPSTPVVVELFTSEGCSSCPPADRLLAQLQQKHQLENAELLLLGEHVDYWNGLGWRDRFSSGDFTERQKDYARALRLSSAYTPQAVVDGHVDVLGSDESGLERAILRAAGVPKTARVSLKWSGDDQVNVAVANAPNGRVLLAVTEDDLTTQVDAGENGGRTLHHSAVVRQLRELGPAANGAYESAVKINWKPEWKRANCRIIVFVQSDTGPVLGAASLKL